MKKLLIIVLVAVVMFPLAVVGIVYIGYLMTDDATVPQVRIQVMDETLTPTGYEWYSPVFGGVRYKQFYEMPSAVATDTGILKESGVNVVLPQNFTASAMLQRGNDIVWRGSGADLANYRFIDNGEYILIVETEREAETGRGYGTFYFRALFNVMVEPRIEVSATAVAQGGVVAIRVLNLSSGMAPEGTAAEGPVIFTDGGDNTMVAFVGVDYLREPGDYSVNVKAGAYEWDVAYTVEEGDFETQELTIDTSDPVISQANSYWAYEEYNTTIPPLYDTFDEQRYWSGRFIEPKTGPLTSPFGVIRYTNGSTEPVRHAGIDIDGETGDSVVAPNNGRVVFAAELMNTGNTVVIEHGGGLKSYFFHLDSIAVAEGQMVAKGEEIGRLGTTGYSTGPHLHYELRLGAESINPVDAFDGISGLYTYDEYGTEE